MRKSVFSLVFALGIASVCVAGDAAFFVDCGFSADGRVYVFGQYGKTDRDFEAWAEIYAVDVERNAFVDNGVFRTQPTAATKGFSGKSAFEALQGKVRWATEKYDCKPANPKDILYIMEDENKSAEREIVFTDFENSLQENPAEYHVTLIPSYDGSGASCQSSFYIDVVKTDADGNRLFSCTVGNPATKRKGITDYQITRILADKENKGLVFVVEKRLEDSKGISIRYMVETTRL